MEPLPLTRAEFLRLVALTALAVPPLRLGARGRGQVRDPGARASTDEMARVIATYDGQGLHRTGTDVDRASGEWLLEEARRRGATVSLETFTLQRFDPVVAALRVGDRRIDGLPLFDGGTTEPAGISGRLGDDASGAPLVLTRLDAPGISTEGRALEPLRRAEHVRGIVAVTAGTQPGLSPSNAARFTSPYGAPVLQVGSEHETWLRERAAAAAEATLIVQVTRTAATATNVVAFVEGRDTTLEPLYVITPRSGWWRCASERGGGIACWLEVMAALGAAAPSRRAVFIASSGHELGHLGLDAAIAARPGSVPGAAAWMHLGANIGAAGGRSRLQTSDDAIEALAVSAFDRAGAVVAERVARGTVPAGEARNIHVGGGRYISLLGSGPYFHNIADRWPVAVDVDAVARFARALAACAVRLASGTQGRGA